MRIIVSGSRTGYDNRRVYTVLNRLLASYDRLVIDEGCADGVDSQVEEWAQSRGAVDVLGRVPSQSVRLEKAPLILAHWPALWTVHGGGCWCGPGKTRCNYAGHRRNLEMLAQQPDAVVTFHEYILNSRGTKHMAEAATQAGVKVVYIGSTL